MNAPTPLARNPGPRTTVLQTQRRRAGGFAWAMLVHLAVALLLGGPVLHPARRAVAAGAEPGIKPRDAVELFAAHPPGGEANEIAPTLRRSPQPPRAGADAVPFVAASGLGLAAAVSSTRPIEAAAPDPRGARRPDHYANAPPSPGRVLT